MPDASDLLFDLPLSWARTSASAPSLRTLRLPLSRHTWIPCADIPLHWHFETIFADILQSQPHGFVLQGCNEALARYILAQGGEVAHVGIEAVIDLQHHMAKPSLLALARRGLRWGTVQPIGHDDAHLQRLTDFRRQTVHHGKPQLQYAFRTTYEPSMQGFAFVGADHRWLGAITLSQMRPGYWHTELLLRRKNARVGVMEALILAVMTHLRAQNASWMSLGTAPFLTTRDALRSRACRHPWSLPCRNDWIMRLGRWLRFGYDYQGLYQFKNKFAPEWRPLYLCGWPTLPWRILPDLSYSSRYLHLLGYQMIHWFS